MINAFTSGKIDQLDILYTQFNNMVSYEPVLKTILPLDAKTFQKQAGKLKTNPPVSTPIALAKSELEFEWKK
jgi:F0F1-type ATP synthase gamma subunit